MFDQVLQIKMYENSFVFDKFHEERIKVKDNDKRQNIRFRKIRNLHEIWKFSNAENVHNI